MDDEAIRQKVRERLKDGRLPRNLPRGTPLKPGQPTPETIVVGSTLDDPCAACGGKGTQIRYEYP
ncbi:MAG TPA: hypothetical protein VJO34_09720, partial [Methylomirabilota bacterium]|nr:hypothetical protein [Methylomirabilota bacterium]